MKSITIKTDCETTIREHAMRGWISPNGLKLYFSVRNWKWMYKLTTNYTF